MERKTPTPAKRQEALVDDCSCDLGGPGRDDSYGGGLPASIAMRRHDRGRAAAVGPVAAQRAKRSARASRNGRRALPVADTMGSAEPARGVDRSIATHQRLERQSWFRRRRDRLGACSLPTFS
jgi:hypothetical protein